MIVFSLFLLFLHGCCCISCDSCIESTTPLPVPKEKQQLIGRWICGKGDYHEFTAEGLYHQRKANEIFRAKHLTSYDEQSWTAKKDVVILGTSHVSLQIDPIQSLLKGALCTKINDTACAKAITVSKELVGYWLGKGISLHIREDGYTELQQVGSSKQFGVLLQTKGQFSLNTCIEVLDLPLTIVAGALLWQGKQLENLNPRWDLQRIRRSPGSSGRGGGFDWD